MWFNVVPNWLCGAFSTRSASGPFDTTLLALRNGSASSAVTIATPSATGPIWCGWICLTGTPSQLNWLSGKHSLAGSISGIASDFDCFTPLLLRFGWPSDSLPALSAICIWSSDGNTNWNFTWFPRAFNVLQGELLWHALSTSLAPIEVTACCALCFTTSAGTPCDLRMCANSSCAFTWSSFPAPHIQGCATTCSLNPCSTKSCRKHLWISEKSGFSGVGSIKRYSARNMIAAAPQLSGMFWLKTGWIATLLHKNACFSLDATNSTNSRSACWIWRNDTDKTWSWMRMMQGIQCPWCNAAVNITLGLLWLSYHCLISWSA